MTKGLSNKEAEEQLKKWGYNELPGAKSTNMWKIALEVMKEPMFILLISCGSVYVLIGDYMEGIILLCSVFIIILITFLQHRKTERSLEALKQLSSPRALVIRNGTEVRIAGREVVPGDLIILQEGDRVPADAELLESNNLSVDESLLTGESAPVLKSIDTLSDKTGNVIFSGTLVVQGKGIAKVISTGTNTQFGKIGKSLQGIKQDETRLQRETKILIRNLFIGSAVITVGVILAFYFTRGNILKAILSGLSGAMALLPEEFPVVLTIFLAMGAWRLSKTKVLTRKPSAIETLGSATVLCSDKTGTITQNQMEVVSLSFKGNIISKKEFSEQNREMIVLLNAFYHASPKDTVDPMEKAIIREYSLWNKSQMQFNFLKEFPLSKELLAMTRIYRNEDRLLAFCKGAPETVFRLCKMTDDELSLQTKNLHDMAAKGYRILAAAQCSLKELPEKQDEIEFSFIGMVAFEDPIRPEVPMAVQECHQAGIKVIMITGDYPATAKSIANQIGLEENSSILTGSELASMALGELQDKIRSTNVFARIVPEQKLQIIQALKANGEIVAMTGDGVNDAPALKAADIGIAMGMKGTDVAREASSLVLLDDNFASIVHAIRSGRRIFDNLQKAMSYIIAIHVPIIGLVLLPAFISTLPILLMPLHIVFMELIIDPVCSIAFEAEQEEKGIMRRKPRNPNELFFGFNKILLSFLKGLILFGVVAAVYFVSIHEGHTEGEVRAIAFSALIIGNVFLILTSLSDTRNMFSVLKERNLPVLIILVAALGLLFLSISIPVLQDIFSFEYPGSSHFIPSFSGALIILCIFELIKVWRKKNKLESNV
jgi:Ca2+-transporting ATPase